MVSMLVSERQNRRRQKLKEEGNYDEYKQQYCLNQQNYRKREREELKKKWN